MMHKNKKSKNEFSINNDVITISRTDWDKSAFASYREDYFEELSTATWSKSGNYLKNSSLGLLHRYIMAKWYGEEELNKFTESGYVVDHLNNDGFDCKISNLEFLKKHHNTAKGQMFDIKTRELRKQIAVSIAKDFSTGCYQIIIACNTKLIYTEPSGNKFIVESIKFLYDCDYGIVINEAENILLVYEQQKRIYIDKDLSCGVRIYEAKFVTATHEELNKPYFSRGNIGFANMEYQGLYIESLPLDEGWRPGNP